MGINGYWPWRFPCATIDVRDLASWVTIAAARHLDETFNATARPPFHQMMAGAARVADGAAELRPVPVAK